MKSFQAVAAAAFAVVLMVSMARAEDWTTKDGKTYTGVTVVKHTSVTVTILDDNGGATIPLSNLSPQLQKEFGYDPVEAAKEAKANETPLEALPPERAALLQKSKVRLVGLVEAVVDGGYVIGSPPSDGGWVPSSDASRPPYQFAGDLANGGTVFLQTANIYNPNDKVDIDAYPMAPRTVSGEKMKAFTTDIVSAIDFQSATLKKTP